MKLYDKWEACAKLFLQGEDVEGYTEDELCNNPDFIKALIRLDKKSYIYMSEELTKDFEFIRDVVTEHKDDYDFCSKLIEDYKADCIIDELDNGDVEAFSPNFRLEEEFKQMNIMELYTIVTSDLKKDLDLFDRDKKGYTVKLSVYYMMLLGYVQSRVSNNSNLEHFGYGFGIIKDVMAGNPELLKYFAERLTMDIVDKEEKVTGYSNNTELVLHNAYKTKEDYQRDGFAIALAKTIKVYDPFLFDYLIINKDKNVLKHYSYMEKQILESWDRVEIDAIYDKTEEFADNIYRAMQILRVPDICTDDVICYVRENLVKDPDDDFFKVLFEEHESLSDSYNEILELREGYDPIEYGLQRNDMHVIKLLDYATYLYTELSKTRMLPKEVVIKNPEEYFKSKAKRIARQRKKTNKKDN